MLRRFSLAVIIACIYAVATLGQPPATAGAAAKFQLADIHPSPHSSSSQQFMRNGFYRGGRYQIRSASMVDLVGLAWGVDADKVSGGPNWLEFDRFDILATAPANASPDALKIMLQNLLADRFQLKVHIDKKEMPTYALTAGRKPLLKEADGSGETGCNFKVDGLPNNGRGGPTEGPPPSLTLVFTCTNMSMPALAEYMHTMPTGNQFLGNNPLVDETGLKGAWNFEFHFGLPNGPGAAAGANVLSDAIDKQLGLKLEARKVPLPVVVVESCNEKPTDNPPGVEKLPVAPTEFEVADIKPSNPDDQGPGRGGGFQPGGRIDLRGITLKQLITVAWDTNDSLVVGEPKFTETEKFDIVARAPTSATGTGTIAGGRGGQPPIDIDSLRLMLRALVIERFNVKTHMEERPMDAYTLLADKPKLKKADPGNRTSFKEGPGPDGKDPRKESPALGRLVYCQNMTMAQLAELLPSIAGGYFQNVTRNVLDSTKVEGAYDFVLSFSGAGILNGNNGRGRGGDGAAAPRAENAAGEASDPGGGITLMDAMDKQIGIKMVTTKRPVPVLVIDHIDQKPTDN